jgi:hypothetical protein
VVQVEITKAIRTTREALFRIFYQRCFWLFVVLLTLIGAVSFVPANDSGHLVLNVVNMFLRIATVAVLPAVSRHRSCNRGKLLLCLWTISSLWLSILPSGPHS